MAAPFDSEALRARVLADPSMPEQVRQALARGAPLEVIRLDAQGRWWHHGLLVENARIAALFSRSIDLTEGGTWVLRIPPFTYPIEVEDTPFLVVRASVRLNPDRIAVMLSDTSHEDLAPDALEYEGPGRILARVKQGRFRARLVRPAFQALFEHIEEDAGQYVLRVGGRRVVLG